MKLIQTTLAALTLSAPAALAHVTLEEQQAPQGATYKAVLRVGHGCLGEATLKLRVQIPEGVIAVKPMPKPGWTLETVTGAYAASYDYYGTPMAEGVKEIVWTGELPDAWYDEFTFRAKLTDALPAGSTIYFPVVQDCATGANQWTQIPAAGQNAHDLEHPAAGLAITEPGHDHH
ncbi:MAG: YcnI family protein [Pseudodonghicola sp.]